MDIKNAVEIKHYIGSTIDEVVESLEEMKEDGQNVWFNFNGHKLYSATVTIDGAYKEICGCTKKEFDEEQKRQHEEWKKKEAEREKAAKAKIPYWVAEGKKYIDKDLWDDWEECVSIRVSDLYRGWDLDAFLEVVKGIDSKAIKSKQDVEKILNEQNHSGSSYGIVKSMIKHFSNYDMLPEETKKAEKGKDKNISLEAK